MTHSVPTRRASDLKTATQAIAQQQSNSAVKLCSSTGVVVSSLVVGALGAALLSALWLVRQRGNIEAETQEMRSALSDAQQRISKYEALIADKNRRIVVWDGTRSEEHTSELQSLMRISYAVFCLKKKTHLQNQTQLST